MHGDAIAVVVCDIDDHRWVIPSGFPEKAPIRAYNERFGHLNILPV